MIKPKTGVSEYCHNTEGNPSRSVAKTVSPVITNKSPSDTTIYAPALKLASPKFSVVAQLLNQQNDNRALADDNSKGEMNGQQEVINESVLERVSNFLEQVR